MKTENIEVPKEIIAHAVELSEWFSKRGVESWELCGVRNRMPEGEVAEAYETVKAWAHRIEDHLNTILDKFTDHADGAPDATDLGKFSNEMIGLSNSIMLKDVMTLRAERDLLAGQVKELEDQTASVVGEASRQVEVSDTLYRKACAERDSIKQQLHVAQRTISLFSSVIKSGESWSEQCDVAMKESMK